MSAYALPGLLFPPLPSSFDIYGSNDSNNNNINISNTHHLHHVNQHHFSSHDRIHVNSSYTGTGNRNSLLSSAMTTASTDHSIPKISIIDAKIDAIRLIQSLMSSSSSPSNTTHHHQRRRRLYSSTMDHRTNDFYDACMIFTFQIGPSKWDDDKNLDSSSIKKHNISTTTTTTITRTLQQILQFNDKLTLQTTNHHTILLNLRRQLNDYDTTTPSDHSQELPSPRNRSFSYLQDQIRSYTPLMELWIRSTVTNIMSLRQQQQQQDLEFKNAIWQLWNDFVSPDDLLTEPWPSNDNMDLCPPMQVQSSPSPATIATQYCETFSVSSSPKVMLSQRRHPLFSTYTSSRNNSHWKKQCKMKKPRRMVSMESIDEEDNNMESIELG